MRNHMGICWKKFPREKTNTKMNEGAVEEQEMKIREVMNVHRYL